MNFFLVKFLSLAFMIGAKYLTKNLELTIRFLNLPFQTPSPPSFNTLPLSSLFPYPPFRNLFFQILHQLNSFLKFRSSKSFIITLPHSTGSLSSILLGHSTTPSIPLHLHPTTPSSSVYISLILLPSLPISSALSM